MHKIVFIWNQDNGVDFRHNKMWNLKFLTVEILFEPKAYLCNIENTIPL